MAVGPSSGGFFAAGRLPMNTDLCPSARWLIEDFTVWRTAICDVGALSPLFFILGCSSFPAALWSVKNPRPAGPSHVGGSEGRARRQGPGRNEGASSTVVRAPLLPHRRNSAGQYRHLLRRVADGPSGADFTHGQINAITGGPWPGDGRGPTVFGGAAGCGVSSSRNPVG